MKKMLLIQMLKNACGCQSTLTELVSPMQSSKIKKKENEKWVSKQSVKETRKVFPHYSLVIVIKK